MFHRATKGTNASLYGHGLPVYYHNCADVSIEGVDDNSRLQPKGIEVVDVPDDDYLQHVNAPEDCAGEYMGKGPDQKEIDANLHDTWN
ncbi:hypothetical protein BGX27_001396 [Mortierella sp. AM989]|nr:hypothetical protein BGX27_001396 [Mortierella sp. AM989]